MKESKGIGLDSLLWMCVPLGLQYDSFETVRRVKVSKLDNDNDKHCLFS